MQAIGSQSCSLKSSAARAQSGSPLAGLVRAPAPLGGRLACSSCWRSGCELQAGPPLPPVLALRCLILRSHARARTSVPLAVSHKEAWHVPAQQGKRHSRLRRQPAAGAAGAASAAASRAAATLRAQPVDEPRRQAPVSVGDLLSLRCLHLNVAGQASAQQQLRQCWSCRPAGRSRSVMPTQRRAAGGVQAGGRLRCVCGPRPAG